MQNKCPSIHEDLGDLKENVEKLRSLACEIVNPESEEDSQRELINKFSKIPLC